MMIRGIVKSPVVKTTAFLFHRIRTNKNIVFGSQLLFSTTTDIIISSNQVEKKIVTFYFQEKKSGDLIKVSGETGKSVLDIALEFNIDIEGACGGQMACSTCHCVLSQDLYDALPQKQEEEQDMLDLALGLTDT